MTWNGSNLLTIAGGLTFTGAQTVQTSTGILTITGTSGLTLSTASNTNLLLSPNGTGVIVCSTANATGVTTGSSLSLSTNSLTTGTGLYIASSTLTSGLLVNLQVSGTAAAASQTALNILTAGATATNAITTYGAQISNTHTNVTSGTNIALYLNASGATTANYALIVNAGNVGIGTATPTRPLQIATQAGISTFFSTNRPADTDSAGCHMATNGTSDWIFGQRDDSTSDFTFFSYGTSTVVMRILRASGNVGIGKSPNYQLEVNTDSAGKPGVGGLWTVVSDERIKTNIVNADLSRCYDIVKSTPLKYFGWKDGIYTDKQVKDKNSLGWVAQDVQIAFPKSVSINPFSKVPIPDGEETVTKDGVTEIRPKFKQEIIEDCLDLNGGQMLMAMYGAVQKLIEKVEALEKV